MSSKPTKKKKQAVEDLSPEDQLLKEKIESLVEKICNLENDKQVTIDSLKELTIEVRKSTRLRTAIPKAMKFLKEHYNSLEEAFDTLNPSPRKQNFADFLSLICNSLKEKYDNDCLRYLQQGTMQMNLEDLGEEYILTLSGDLANEYLNLLEEEKDPSQIHELTKQILPVMFRTGNEINVVDLLLEVDRLDLLKEHVTDDNFTRIFNYLVASVNYTADNVEFESIMNTLYDVALHLGKLSSALRVAIRWNSKEKIMEVMAQCTDAPLRKQFCFMLGRHRYPTIIK
jgi:26S proteasome regulatory subunit N1